MDDLGTLTDHSVREYFEHEEEEFTPWLANNIEVLENDELLGFDIENPEIERTIGGYRADIVAEDAYDGRSVVIENQFGRTDHDHLGKSLVYAAGAEADVVVWIAEEFNPEHAAAVREHNERTDDEFAFFAFEVGLKRIDDSPYAIDFTPVAKPDDWVGPDPRTETERAQVNFWDEFRMALRDRGLDEFATHGTRASASYAIRIGISDAYIRPTMNSRTNTLHTVIRITDQDGEFAGLDRASAEDAIRDAISRNDFESIDEGVVNELDWESNPGNKYDKIRLTYGDADLCDESKWDEYHQWLADVAEAFAHMLNEEMT